MKRLPSLLLTGALALTLRAETPLPQAATTPAPKTEPAPATPAPKSSPAPAKPASGDPFVKDPATGEKTPDNDTFPNCHFVLEIYALNTSDAATLLETEASSAARYRRVREFAKVGKARLDTLTALTGRSGQRSTVEAIDTVRYPVEFTPPGTAKGALAPSVWETRNVGDTLELEPVIEPDNRTCAINLVPQRVTLAGFRDAPDAQDGLAASQPVFDTQKITTSVSAIDGQPLYLGTMSRAIPQGAADGGAQSEVRLAFLHVSFVEVRTSRAPARIKANNARLQCEFVYSFYSLDRADARDVLVAPASIGAPWEKLQAMVAAGKARLEHISTIKTKSGQRAAVDEIQEERYMSEYNPGSGIGKTARTEHTTTTELPVTGAAKADANDKQKGAGAAKTEVARKQTVTETTATTWRSPEDPQAPGYPTAFETVSAGITIEVEPVAGPENVNTVIDLNESIKSVKYPGNLKGTGAGARYPAQPVFEMATIITTQSAPEGAHVFVSTMNPPGANGVNERTDTGRTWLLFVHASVTDP